MTSVLEPIAAGILVAIINKKIINSCNNIWMFDQCMTTTHETRHEDDSSTTTTINSDVEHVHIHY